MRTPSRITDFILVALALSLLRVAAESRITTYLHVEEGVGAAAYWIVPVVCAIIFAFLVPIRRETRFASLKVTGAAILGVLITEAVLGVSEYLVWRGMVSPAVLGNDVNLFTLRALHASPMIALTISLFAGTFGGAVALVIHGLSIAFGRSRKMA